MSRSSLTEASRKPWRPPRRDPAWWRGGHAASLRALPFSPMTNITGNRHDLAEEIGEVAVAGPVSVRVPGSHRIERFAPGRGAPRSPAPRTPLPARNKRSAASGGSRSRLALRAAMLSLLRLPSSALARREFPKSRPRAGAMLISPILFIGVEPRRPRYALSGAALLLPACCRFKRGFVQKPGSPPSDWRYKGQSQRHEIRRHPGTSGRNRGCSTLPARWMSAHPRAHTGPHRRSRTEKAVQSRDANWAKSCRDDRSSQAVRVLSQRALDAAGVANRMAIPPATRCCRNSWLMAGELSDACAVQSCQPLNGTGSLPLNSL